MNFPCIVLVRIFQNSFLKNIIAKLCLNTLHCNQMLIENSVRTLKENIKMELMNCFVAHISLS